MPPFITVYWSDGTNSPVYLDASTSKNKTAHYRDYYSAHLNLMPITATANIDDSLCGNFEISHGPSNASIIVIKNTDSGEAMFHFNTTGGNGLPASFSITTSGTFPFTGTTSYNVWVDSSGATFGIAEDLTGMNDWVLDSSSVSVSGTPASFLVTPESIVTVTFNNKIKPSQVLPELPAGFLLGLGLVGTGGFLWFKRQKRSIPAG